jgi:hypothetical protein
MMSTRIKKSPPHGGFFVLAKFLLLLSIPIGNSVKAQTPAFSNETAVNILGLTIDAMEPFISADDQTLFFNSLNDGVNTSLYYASRINDSTFQFEGLVLNVNQAPPHLDAVASIDQNENFYWVSTRNYPTVIENLQHGNYTNGVVVNGGKVYGDFYINSPGWIVMDAAITMTGNKLIYSNAYFNNCNQGLPCKAMLGIAIKVNDSTFQRSPNSAVLFSAINDTNFIVYAPQLSTNGLELFYTRLKKNTIETQICISTRGDTITSFPAGTVIVSETGATPEAPTISTDGLRMYYHRYSNGKYRLFMRRRISSSIAEQHSTAFILFPTVSTNVINYQLADLPESYCISDQSGREKKWSLITSQNGTISVNELAAGMYYITVHFSNRNSITRKFIKVTQHE